MKCLKSEEPVKICYFPTYVILHKFNVVSIIFYLRVSPKRPKSNMFLLFLYYIAMKPWKEITESATKVHSFTGWQKERGIMLDRCLLESR